MELRFLGRATSTDTSSVTEYKFENVGYRIVCVTQSRGRTDRVQLDDGLYGHYRWSCLLLIQSPLPRNVGHSDQWWCAWNHTFVEPIVSKWRGRIWWIYMSPKDCITKKKINQDRWSRFRLTVSEFNTGFCSSQYYSRNLEQRMSVPTACFRNYKMFHNSVYDQLITGKVGRVLN